MISLGIGTTASYDIQIGCDDEVLYDNWGPFYYGARTYHQAQSYLENTYHPVLIDVEYHYQESKHWAYGLTLGLHTAYQKERRFSDRKTIHEERHTHLSFVASARYYWRTKDWVRTYSELGLGVAQKWEKEFYDEHYDKNTIITAHITALGIEVGNGPIVGFGEVGLGAFGCLRAGIGYRF